MAVKEAEYERRMEQQYAQHKKELDEVKGREYVLKARLKEAEKGDAAFRRLTHSSETLAAHPTLDEKTMADIQKDIQAQDQLFEAYEKENKRLADKAKEAEEELKTVQRTLYNANAVMEKEKEELEARCKALEEIVEKESLPTPERYGKMMRLKDELEETKRYYIGVVDDMKEEVAKLKEEKKEMEKRIRQSESMLDPVMIPSTEVKKMREEAEAVQREYERKILSLEEKLKWHVYNERMISDMEGAMKEHQHRAEMLNEDVNDYRSVVGVDIRKHKLENGGKIDKLKLRKQLESKEMKIMRKKLAEMEEIAKNRQKDPSSTAELIRAVQPSSKSAEELKEAKKKIAELEQKVKAKDSERLRAIHGLKQEYDQMQQHYSTLLKQTEKEKQTKKKRHDRSVCESWSNSWKMCGHTTSNE
uniref:Centrosomal protein of 162 kDa n=1 Tax=Palpitomonas bilix TaxID=652834 RepID=A0A7S3DBZ4_9EUKA